MATLIVAGFHRSGTSLLTELLHAAGLFVGDDLLGAMPSNPYGHFEDREVLRIHNTFLDDNGLNWQVDRPFLPYIGARRWDAIQSFVDRRRSGHPLWGFKDPRVCLFMPVWRHVVPDAKAVVVYREPAACVASLHRRQTADLVERSGPLESHRRFWAEPDLGLRMWLVHNRALLDYARMYPDDSMVVSFRALSRGFEIVDQIRERWGLSLRSMPTAKVFDPAVTSGPAPLRVIDSSLLQEADDVLAGLQALDASHIESQEVEV